MDIRVLPQPRYLGRRGDQVVTQLEDEHAAGKPGDSTISYNRSANYVLGMLVIVENGTVTAGKFTGDSVTHVVELLNLNLLAWRHRRDP